MAFSFNHNCFSAKKWKTYIHNTPGSTNIAIPGKWGAPEWVDVISLLNMVIFQNGNLQLESPCSIGNTSSFQMYIVCLHDQWFTNEYHMVNFLLYIPTWLVYQMVIPISRGSDSSSWIASQLEWKNGSPQDDVIDVSLYKPFWSIFHWTR